MSKKILIIIPAYNEEASIAKTLSTVKASGYDYVVINDGSTDDTLKILQQEKCNYINLASNLGIGGAMQTGYKYALENNYDIAIQFDADGQHNISFIDELTAPILNGRADLTIGSCFIDKSSKSLRSSRIRSFGIKCLSNFIRLLSGKRIHDITSGFRAANRAVLTRFANNYPLEYPEPVSNYELLRDRSIKVLEIPVKMNKRANGKSSINSWKNLYAAFNVLISIIIITLRRNND